jgi:cytidine deaminase
MDQIVLKTEIKYAKSVGELSEAQRFAIEKAIKIAQNAYAPYSRYNVGAAIELENGEIIAGSNQENASFPAGTCAERSALFYAGSNYPNIKIIRVAVTTLFPTEKPVAPCGICRQALMEYEVRQGSPIELLMTHPKGGVYISESISNILPLGFRFKQ